MCIRGGRRTKRIGKWQSVADVRIDRGQSEQWPGMAQLSNTMTSQANLRRRLETATLAVALLTSVSGCAAHGKSFSTRFVKAGEPSASFDAPGETHQVDPKPES